MAGVLEGWDVKDNRKPILTAREVDQLLGVNGNHIPNNGYVTREDRRRVAEAYREMERELIRKGESA